MDINQKYTVKYNSNVLGHGEKTMTLDEIKSFNKAAYIAACEVSKTNKPFTFGMWTVSLQNNKENSNG